MSGSSCGEPKAKKLGRRAYLVQKLMDGQHLSRRKATEIVNIVLERMIAALKRDHEVEFPLGKLKLVPHHHRMQEGKFLGRKRTIYRRRWTVVHEMDEKGNRLLNPPPPKPKRRVVLPPYPFKEEVAENMISREHRTMRGAKKKLLPPKPVEPPVLRRPGQVVLPPPPSSPPGTPPFVVNPLRHPVVLPPRPGKKSSGK